MVAALSALQSRNAVVNSFKCFYVGHLVLFWKGEGNIMVADLLKKSLEALRNNT